MSDEAAREKALAAVEERLRDLIPETPDMGEEWHADQADDIVALVEAAFDEDRCPTCGGTGPDTIDRVGDYGGDIFEARCGDEWHDDQPQAASDEGRAE